MKVFELIFSSIVLFLVIVINGLLHQLEIFNWWVLALNLLIIIRWIRAILLIRINQ